MSIEADFAKVRGFIEHEREMRECCTDLPDYMCAPIHTEAALSRIEAALKLAHEQLALAKAAHGANARVRRRIRRIEAHDDAKAVAALARKCSAKTAEIADLSRQLAEANERYTRYHDVVVQVFDRRKAALNSVAQDRDRLAKELAALRAGYDSDGGHPMKETL